MTIRENKTNEHYYYFRQALIQYTHRHHNNTQAQRGTAIHRDANGREMEQQTKHEKARRKVSTIDIRFFFFCKMRSENVETQLHLSALKAL